MKGDNLKNARELEAERAQHEKAVKGPLTLRKARVRLYERIKGKVSVKAMNYIVYGIVALIFLVLILGIVTGKP